jgi:hypothetical protein
MAPTNTAMIDETGAVTPRSASRVRGAFVVATLAATLTAMVLLVRRVPTVQRLPLWFWGFHDKPTSPVVCLFLLLALSVALVGLHLRRTPSRRLIVDVLPFFVFGLVLQYGVAASEMRGIQGIRDRFLRSGHVQFAHIAVFEPDLVDVLVHYDSFTTKPNMIFARSKPPGTVIMYILVERASLILPRALAEYAPEPDMSESMLRSANMAVLVFPLFSMLVLFPLGALARAFLPAGVARWPLLLYALCPPVDLIPLHLDQALFPLLQTTLTLVLFRVARERVPLKAWLLVVAAGGLIWASLFITFSLLPGIVLAVLFGAAEVLFERDMTMNARIGRIARGAGVLVVVFFVLSVIAYALMRYDPIVRFQHAMAHHKQFKTWQASADVVVASAFLDAVEYVYVLGLPLMAGFFWALGGHLRRCALRTSTSFDRFAALTALVLVLLPLTSMTQGEVARLWLFLVPNVVLLAAAGVRALAPAATLTTFAGLAVLELVWTMMLKHASDLF